MICFRCGSEVAEGAPQCANCGQRFAGSRKTFTATTTSLRAIEKRKARAQKASEKLPFQLGDVVKSRYEIRHLIGLGPLGVVYRAHDQEIEVDVALKVLHDGLYSATQGREAFSQTIRKVRKLSQQNIVRLYDSDLDGDHPFYTMQLLEGLTLRKIIGLRQTTGQPFTVKEIEPVMLQISMALGHAHRHTVHGDLKPENIIILPDVLKVTDFAAHEIVPTGVFVKAQLEAGLGAYMSPELIASGAVDPRSDIYSLGAIFYELLTGTVHHRDAPPPSQVLSQPDEAQAEGIDAFVARATAENPRDRFESAESFIEALATYVDGRELRSVDIRAPKPLFPDDMTRRVQAPEGLQDGSAQDLLADDEAELSLVDELDEDDLEAERSFESTGDRRDQKASTGTVPRGKPDAELETRPWESLGRVDETEPALAVFVASVAPTQGGATPWFVRSNVGFVAAVFVIVMCVIAGTYFVIGRLQQPRPQTPVRQQVVRVMVDAGVPVAAPTSAMVEARPRIVAAEPASLAAVASPVIPAARPPAPVSERSVATQRPTPALTPSPVPPRPTAPPPRATEAPRPAAASEASVSRPAPPPEPAAPPPPPKSTNEKVSCASGMILIPTGPFPKGSIKGRDVLGAEAVAMARDGKAYCIDGYEYPGAGASPKTQVTFDAAGALCKASGKRLCADTEWQRACRGGGGDFPYGKTFDAARCNTEDADGEARSLAAAGKFSKCRSASGAVDMSGNVAEWTGEQTVRGGDFTSADEDAQCSAGGRRSAGSTTPRIGFRCCADLK